MKPLITGATGILLFYSLMSGTTLTIKPNDRSRHCGNCLEVEQMNETIITSAKSIVNGKSNVDQLDALEAKVDSLESILRTMNQKIDSLLMHK
jgi:hypothetical protein